MSDIGGKGYGSDHNWKRGGTAQVKSNYWAKQTLYVCKDCGQTFAHNKRSEMTYQVDYEERLKELMALKEKGVVEL